MPNILTTNASQINHTLLKWYVIRFENFSFNSTALFKEVINKIVNLDPVNSYYFNFNSKQIHLFLSIDEEYKNDIYKLSQAYTDKLNLMFSDDSKIIYFIDFKKHSSDEFNHYKIDKKFYFKEELSEIMLDIFNNEDLNDDNILLISYYFQLCWIVSSNHHNNESLVSTLLKGYVFNTAESEHQITLYESLYFKNLELLTEIAQNIIHANSNYISTNPVWIRKFLTICKTYLESNMQLKKKGMYEMTFHIIPNYINNQMGLSPGFRGLQYYIINKLLPQIKY